MRPRCRLWPLGLVVLMVAGTSCSRSNLTVIGRTPTIDASRSDAMDGSAAADADDGSATTVTCPSVALQPGDTTQTVQVGSTSRSYVLHVPSQYDGSKRAPLVVDFHALTGTGSGERRGSPYPAFTDPEGVVMAFPDGLKGPSGTAWNIGPCCVLNTIDDVAFTRAMIKQIETTACIDFKRVYAVGVSMGGGMAYYLACQAADVVAAVAPAAFDMLDTPDCTPSRPVTVISFRGAADGLVPYAGGSSSVVLGMSVTFLGAQGTFKKWADIDQCTDSPSAEDSNNGCSSYSACQGGVEVFLCTKPGGGQEAGNAGVAWPVLKRHTL